MQSYKHYFLALLIALSSSPAFAKQFWQESQVKPDLGNTQVNARADEARYVSFRHEEMEKQFLLSRQFMELAVPAPDGKNINIRLVEDSVMAPGLAAKFPGIKSYKALNELGEQIGRFSYSHKGLRGMYKYNNEWAFLDPLFTNRTEQYISYFKSRAKKVGQQSFNEDLSRLLDFRKRAFKPGEISVTNKAANTMRTYRIAVTATGEYTEFHGGTVADALAAINSMINRINQVYLVDMAVQFQIVDNNDAIIYRDGETDPFSNNTDDIDLNQQIIDEQIGSANYDIGHIVNTSDGGLASLGSVCSSSSKAQGVTGLSFPTGDTFYIDYVAHEIGHQFDAGHTFNGSLGACAGSRTPNSSWEPGSGSTIMGYASICESQNIQSFSDAFFHIGSIAQMRGFIDEGLGGTCGSETSITNITPTVDAGEDFNIPANTPFTLTGSGSDADGDELTYIWEQLDLGAASSGPDDMVDNGNRPLFRSFMPQSEPVRTLPQISDVFAGTTTLGETYPTTARDLNFVLTARDNNGGLAVDTMVVRTTSSVSGFTLMQPNETKSWEAGRQSLLYWNNAGSDEAPISCNSITLDMTNDDGSTYITISTDIVNDSLAVVTAPSSTGDYRFRLRCENNIFFTISAGNISIVTATSTDTDSDGMSDEFESDNGLDPNDASDASLDSDGDGLSNLEESLIGSNINNADSDNDGLPDAFEIANYLDPIDASDADADADGDGVSNLVEYQQGSDPNDPLSNPFVSEQVYSFESATELDKWTLYGSVPWRLSTDEANDGVISLQAGEIFDGGLSILSYIDVMAAGSLAFDVKLSTEEGFDFLHIFVNDVNVLSLSGIADWTTYSIPVGSGANVIQWVYAKDDSVSVGQDTVWIDNIRTPVSSETFVSDVSGSNTESSFQFESTQGLDNWSLNDSVSWLHASGSVGEGNFSLGSFPISDSRTSVVSYTDTFEAGDLSFFVKVSTEENFDFLRFFVDGELVQEWSGEMDFTEVVHTLTAGEHTLTWSYEKDRSESAGQDRVWIDNVTLPGKTTTEPTEPEAYVPFDYDKDGKADVAVRRASNFFQYVKYSESDDIGRFQFGRGDSDIPVSGDFDGDGITDIAVRRPSNQFWYILNSSGTDRISGNDDGITRRAFGLQATDIPVPADYDGDGITDLAVRRPSNQFWYILNSSGVDSISNNDDGITRIRFGTQEADIPVPADYDGDGKADLAVRRPGTQFWYVRNSSGEDPATGNSDGITRLRFGLQESDIPVPADYDGDGKVDFAVRRPSNFFWFVRNSSGTDERSNSNDGITRVQFGRSSSDIPVVADYDGDGKADFAVRRASNQFFYIQNSGGGNFNSANEDGIQRINFGMQSTDIPLAAPVLTRMLFAQPE